MGGRIFFIEHSSPTETTTIPTRADSHPSPIEKYFRVLESYLRNWNSETGSTPDIFIRQNEEILTKEATNFCVYLLLLENPTGKKIIDAPMPTSVGRNAYAVSPLAVVKRSHINPAGHFFELPPTDRLFGYVAYHDKARSDFGRDSDPASSSKERISVTSVSLSNSEGIGDSVLRSRPLLNPRPSSARRFLTRVDGSNTNSSGHKVRRNQYFSTEPKQALGATTYPIDRGAWTLIDKEAGFPKKASKARNDTDNVTPEVRSYVRTDTKFKVTIYYKALTHFELAWLPWILDPTNLVPRVQRQQRMSSTPSDQVGYLRPGTGEPLGLGIMEVTLSPDGLQASKSVANNGDTPSSCSAYIQLTGCLGTVTIITDPTQFQVLREYLVAPWVEVFRRSCFGYNDAFDVRHFTLDENKENNRTDWTTGLSVEGARVEPDVFWGSRSDTPISVSKRQKKNRR